MVDGSHEVEFKPQGLIHFIHAQIGKFWNWESHYGLNYTPSPLPYKDMLKSSPPYFIM